LSPPAFRGLAVDSRAEKIGALLHEAAETHHIVFRIVNGEDADWATWYADWLVNHSELQSVLGSQVVRSELTYLLVKLDKDYVSTSPSQKWEDYYAEGLIKEYGGAASA
jgi:hypothetical protein